MPRSFHLEISGCNMGKDRASDKTYWPWWRSLLVGLNMMALMLSVILGWHYLRGGSIAGCGGGSACGQVLNSRWSAIGGIFPISGLAIGAYLALLFAGFFIGHDSDASIRRLAWRVMIMLSGAIS